MEAGHIVALVLGTNFISAVLTFLITRMQVSHSDKRLEKELERARDTDYRQRRWEVRSEPLLNLRNELAIAATKYDRLVRAAYTKHTHFGVTEETITKELQEALEDFNNYMISGNLKQILLLQCNEELVNRVEEILEDYSKSYTDFEHFFDELTATELGKSREVLNINNTRIIEVQELINKQLEEL